MNWRASLGLLLLACALALVLQTRRLGLTVDETSHFAAAYSYWLGEDVLQPSDAPPLTRLICGWVPRLLNAPLPATTAGWKDRDAYMIGAEILDRTDIRARRLLFYTRLPFLVFPLLIVFLIGHWARQLFDDRIALALAACAALEPTIQGHGSLIHSDVPAALAALWFGYAAWRYLNHPDWRRLLILSLAVTLAVLTKFTLLPLAFAGFALALWKGPRWLAPIVPAIAYLGILAASQFQAQPISSAEVSQFAGAGVPGWALGPTRLIAHLPWPQQFVRGLLYIGGSMQGQGFTGYLWGHKIEGWVPLYFPAAWAIKFPIPLQLLTLAGLAASLRRDLPKAGALIWGLAAFLLGTAMLSNFHLGFRHILPAVPFLILGGGFALLRWRARAFAAIGLVWLATSALHCWPHGISYFNEWIGAPSQGWRYLADSNIDWGQDLPELGAYMRRNRVDRVKTFIFGFDNPYFYLPPGSMDPQPMPPGTDRVYRPQSGTYAISVNFLTGVLFPKGYEDYLIDFRRRTPDAHAGYGILVYRVP